MKVAIVCDDGFDAHFTISKKTTCMELLERLCNLRRSKPLKASGAKIFPALDISASVCDLARMSSDTSLEYIFPDVVLSTLHDESTQAIEFRADGFLFHENRTMRAYIDQMKQFVEQQAVTNNIFVQSVNSFLGNYDGHSNISIPSITQSSSTNRLERVRQLTSAYMQEMELVLDSTNNSSRNSSNTSQFRTEKGVVDDSHMDIEEEQMLNEAKGTINYSIFQNRNLY